MKTFKIIEKLAQLARKEPIPSFDVTKTVMYEITALQQQQTSYLPFDFIAAASAVAASIITITSLSSWVSVLNPALRLFTPLQEIPLW